MNNICVFAGSSPGSRLEYKEAAIHLAQELVSRNFGLVYGGAKVGLMGILADSVLQDGGHVIGVIPESLKSKEVAHEGVSELRVVSSMHERKELMANLSDGFIALPGGFGTIEETIEILTWAQLGLHKKPCGLLDVCGFYQDLLSFLGKCVKERFVKEEHMSMLLVDKSPKSLLDRFESYRAPDIDKWIDRCSVSGGV